jgi:hypothetical protein
VRAPTTFVLATTTHGTRAALKAAARHVGERGNLVLLVPCLTNRGQPNVAPEQTTSLIDRYRALAEEQCPSAAVYVVVCHRPEDAFRQFLTEPPTVVLGGRRSRWWWPSAERRMAKRLSRQGYRIVFEDLAG